MTTERQSMGGEPVFPLVHANGTPISLLQADYTNAQRMLVRAMLHFQSIDFNQRDYYPLGETAFEAAKAERLRIAECLKSAETYLTNHVEYLVEVRDNIATQRTGEG